MSDSDVLLVRPATGPAVIASSELNAANVKKVELRWAIEQAQASSRIEGHIPTPEHLADCEAVIAGTMTFDEAVAAGIKRGQEEDHRIARAGGGNGA